MRNHKLNESAARSRRPSRKSSRDDRRSARRRRLLENLETRSLLASDLVISEFMASNNATLQDDDGQYSDWIEIRNTTAAPVSLNGWYLSDDSGALNRWQFPNQTVPANGQIVVFASGKDRATVGNPLHTNFKLDADGEYLALVQPDGITIATHFSPEYAQQYADISYGFSLNQTTQGYFTTPTPGSPNTTDPASDPTKQVVISEIMYHPSSENNAEEYIELYNRGTQTVDLANWSISRGVDFTFPAVSTPLAAGARLVIAADLPAFQAKYPGVTNVVGGWTGQLSNRGETIEVNDASGQTIDRVQYFDQGDWATRIRGPLDNGFEGWRWYAAHDGAGSSLELVNPALSNNTGHNWASSLTAQGTPGAANSVHDTDIAPALLDVSHFPLIPRSTDQVTITAKIIDESATGHTVTAYYRADGAATFTALVMWDDGLHGDGAAGDKLYGAMVPAQANGTIIEFYVEASDAAANVRTSPGPAVSNDLSTNLGQVANLLYQVDDTYDPNAAWTPGSQPIFRIIMTQAERAQLADIGDGEGSGFGNGEAESNAQMNGTFVAIDGIGAEVRYNIGIRNRGHGSRIGPPNNYRVNFPHDRDLKGLTALDINSRFVHLQALGLDVFQLAGLPAPDGNNIQLRINGQNLAQSGGVMFGSYVAVEPSDSNFADNHFPKDNNGNIYRAVRLDSNAQQADFRYEGTDPNAYRDTYFKETNQELDDWSDLINMTNVINNAPDATYLEEVSQVINVQQWLRYIALNSLLLNTESGLTTGDGDDFHMYAGITDPRFVLFPHDLDSIFGQGAPSGNINQDIFSIVGGGGGSSVDGLVRFMNHPSIVPLYYQAFFDLIARVFNPDVINPLVDRKLGGFVPAANIAAIKQFVVNRTAAVLAQIPQNLTVTSTLPIVNGYHTVVGDQTQLNGVANALHTRSVLVNGVPATWSPRGATWSISSGVPLNPGINRVLVQAFDGANGTGNEISRGFLDLMYSPGSTVGATLSIPTGSTWKFLDDGSDQATAWRNEGFDDSSWAEGPAELGYGDGDEATTVGFIDTDPNTGGTQRNITTYFRKTFTIPAGDAAKFDELKVRLLADDGASVYINGVEVIRTNLPGTLGDNSITFTTRASTFIADEDAFVEYNLDPSVLQDGVNTIAVEIHQNAPSSSDISFDLELNALEIVTGVATPVSGILEANTTWTAAGGPYQVTGTVTVPAGRTLTIEPGTTIYFEPGTQLTVNGVIIAQGTPTARIRMTGVPGAALVPDVRPELPPSAPKWGGVQIVGSNSPLNVIAYADIEHAQSTTGSIGIRNNSQAVIDNVSFAGTHLRMVYSNASSVIVRNSIFPDMFAANEEPLFMTPPLDNISEHIKGEGGIPAGGHYIIQGNIFGTNKGHNDVIDVDSNQLPGPILQILDNVFFGAGDELYDGGGDVLVEGNLFQNVIKDLSNDGTGDANVLSTGDTAVTVLSVNRNYFVNIDHAINFKLGSYGYFENNTIVNLTAAHQSLPTDPPSRLVDFSVINFLIPNEVDPVNGAPRDWPPGKGAYTSGNIFHNIPGAPVPQYIFGHVDFVHNNQAEYPFTPQVLELHKSLIPRTEVVSNADGKQGRVFDYLVGDPRFVNAAAGDFRLGPGSPAIGTGPNGQNMGADVPGGATISGEPPALTTSTTATLTVGGPGIFSFDWRLDGGPWQSEIVIRDPRANLDDPNKARTFDLQLSGLSNGPHTVEVRGRNFAGVLQQTPTVSKTWTVNTSLQLLMINEVLALNGTTLDLGGTRPDVIELHNAGAAAVDVSDMSISDNPNNPRKFVFPAGTTIAPGGYLLLYADSLPSQGGELHTGFALSSTEGEGVWLYNKPAVGGALVDNVEFGRQVRDLSIGRVGHNREWGLNQPTLGSANIAQQTGDPRALKINEWLASPGAAFPDDFIELYNTDELPVAIGGFYLTDDAAGEPTQHQLAPLSFIGGLDYMVFLADDNAGAGEDHLNFNLSPQHELIGLFAADGSLIDQVLVTNQMTGVSQGRVPDGGPQYQFFTTPTPGLDTSPPSAPGNLNFTFTSSTRNDLAWTAAVDPQSGVSFYKIYRNGVEIGTSTTTSFSDTTVQPDMLYTYRVSAFNFDNFESELSNLILTGADSTAPSVPLNLDATLPGTTQIDITWSPSADPETGIDFYRIYRDGAEVGTSTTTSFSDTTVSASQSYYYQIAAVNAVGLESNLSGRIYIAKFQDGISPAGYSGTADATANQDTPTSTAGGTAGTITMDGDTGNNNNDRNGFIKWDLSSIPVDSIVKGTSLMVLITDTSGGSYNLFQLKRNWVETQVSWNQYANGSNWEQGGGLGPLDRSDTVLGAMFGPSDNTVSTTTLNAAGESVVQSWIDGTVPNYGFLIHNTSNNSGMGFTSRDSGTAANRPRLVVIYTEPVAPDATAPTTPTGLQATNTGSSQVTLNWNAASDPESGIALYKVYRNGSLIGMPTENTFVDNDALPGMEYSYRVSAVNGVNMESAQSPALVHQIPLALAGQTLQIGVPGGYLPGVPVLVRVEILGADGKPDRSIWDAGALLSIDNPNVTLSTNEVRLYNGLGSALVTFTGSGSFNLTASVGGLQSARALNSLAGQPQTNVSGTLPGAATTWSGIVHVTGDVTVPVGHTLTIQPGTLILVDGNSTSQSTDGKDIIVRGTIKSLGTAANPITFTATNPNAPWGEIFHDGAVNSQYQYTDITRAGHSPDRGHTSTGPAIRFQNSGVTFDRVNVTDIAGKIGWSVGGSSLTFTNSLFARAVMGPEIDDTALLFDNSYIIDMLGIYREDGIIDDDDGIYIHSQQAGQTIVLQNSVIARGEDDAIDTLGSTVTIDNLIIRDYDNPLEDSKGVSVSEGNVTIRRTLIVNNALGVAIKSLGGNVGIVTIDRSTIVNNVVGLERTDGAGIEMIVTNSIVHGTGDTIVDGGIPASLRITYSNLNEAWPGTGNTTVDPLFVNAALNDYRLQPGSPAINTGNPAASLDPDGTRADMGAFPFFQLIVTVNPLSTTDRTPALTGAINDPTATIQVTVNGQTYPAVNNGNGTWTLADDTISPSLANGTYSILAEATNSSASVTDLTTNELVINAPTTTFIVTNIANEGAGSLRQAIIDANNNAGSPHTIIFNIPGAGPHLILPTTPLPAIIDPMSFEIPAGITVQIGAAAGATLGNYTTLSKTGPGTLAIGGAQNYTAPATIDVSAGTLRMASDGGTNLTIHSSANVSFRSVQHLAGLQLDDGATASILAGGSNVLVVNNLALAPTAKLDITDNKLIVRANGASREAVLQAVSGYVASGANGLAWDGAGITSSLAANDVNFLSAVGIMLNDDGLGNPFHPSFAGQTVDQNAILVRHTYYGDADLTGYVDGTDYALIDNGFNAGLTGWFNGDFSHDNVIDGTDYALIDNAFNAQGAPLATFGPDADALRFSLALQPLALDSALAAPVASGQSTAASSASREESHSAVFDGGLEEELELDSSVGLLLDRSDDNVDALFAQLDDELLELLVDGGSE